MRELLVAYVAEDEVQAQFLEGSIRAAAAVAGGGCDVQQIGGRGGIGGVKATLSSYTRRLLAPGTGLTVPDVLVCMVDANREGPAARRQEVEGCLAVGAVPQVVIGTPDPHVERWLMVDEQVFQDVARVHPPADPGSTAKDVYKQLLGSALAKVDADLDIDAADLARDIGRGLVPVRARVRERSARRFLDDIVAAMRLGSGAD